MFLFKKKESPLEQATPDLEQGLKSLKEMSMNEKIDVLAEKLEYLIPGDDLKKKKVLKLPFQVKRRLKTISKHNQVLVFMLRRNRSIEPMIGELKEGMLFVKGRGTTRIHNGGMDFTYLWQGKYPSMVVPEWDLNPIGTEDYYRAIDKGSTIDAQDIVIKAVEMAKQDMAKTEGMGSKWIIWIVLGAIGLGYIIFG